MQQHTFLDLVHLQLIETDPNWQKPECDLFALHVHKKQIERTTSRETDSFPEMIYSLIDFITFYQHNQHPINKFSTNPAVTPITTVDLFF